MYCTPKDEVVRFIEERGARILDISENKMCGDDFLSYQYVVRSRAGSGCRGGCGRPGTDIIRIEEIPPRRTGPAMSIDWTPACRPDRQPHDRFLVTTHVRPDGDALGSEVGMVGLLRQKGKDVRVVNSSRTPPRYDFLDPEGPCSSTSGRRPTPPTWPTARPW